MFNNDEDFFISKIIMMKILCISGRKEIIAEFKNLVSSFPEEMSTMQSELSKYKEAASDIHSLRADVQSLSSTLERKVGIFIRLAISLDAV